MASFVMTTMQLLDKREVIRHRVLVAFVAFCLVIDDLRV